MKTLQEIQEMWAQDCVIDDMKLDEESLKIPNLHAKYIELYSYYKLRLKKVEQEHAILLKNKWLWYTGKMSKEEIDKLGWSYDDPFNGLKVLKSDMEYYYSTDKDIQRSEARIEMVKTILSVLEEILTAIKWRHQHIRAAIEHRKFMAGG